MTGQMRTEYIDIVFDGLPSHEGGRFVEVEDHTGRSISFGEWVKRPDGYWALRFSRTPVEEARPVETARTMRCSHCGHTSESFGIGAVYCGPHEDKTGHAVWPAVRMQEVEEVRQTDDVLDPQRKEKME